MITVRNEHSTGPYRMKFYVDGEGNITEVFQAIDQYFNSDSHIKVTFLKMELEISGSFIRGYIFYEFGSNPTEE